MKYAAIFILIFAFQLMAVGVMAQERVEYDLHINDTIVNYTGKQKSAMAINGLIPAPVLRFTEGDTAVIRIYNHMKTETSLHWHGILLPNQFDGVSYLTSKPVAPGSMVTYTFPIIQNGTYWYRSHTGLQEQAGLYGAFIIDKRKNAPLYRDLDNLPEHTILLSDWTDTKPEEVYRRLRTGNDWPAIKKGSVQSYGEALTSGHFGTKLVSEWKRMKAMDVSDVYYEAYLANGKPEVLIDGTKPGDRVRLRIINGGSSTYFWLQYSGGKITVVANDGMDVEPVEVDRMIVAVSETYDIVVTVPEAGMACELLATSEDRTGAVSVWVGSGERIPQPPLAKLNYFAGMKMMNGMMKMNGDVSNMGMELSLQKMDMNEVMYPEITSKQHDHTSPKADSDMGQHAHSMGNDASMHMDHSAHTDTTTQHQIHSGHESQLITLNYDMLRSPFKTTLPGGSFRELQFELNGNMDRYVWTLDNKTVSESDKIRIREGENLRIVIRNNSMMRHPMHLHGHFFRVLNQYGEYSPLKFGVDIMPAETDTLEFHAGEVSRGDWFFHCHILYHMMSGMGRVFSYEDSPPNPQIPDPHMAWHMFRHDDRMFSFAIRNDFMFNGNQGKTEYSNTRWAIQGEWKLGYDRDKGFEADLRAGRYIGKMQWLYPYIGVSWNNRRGAKDEKNIFGQKLHGDNIFTGTLGTRYTLPLFIVADARIDTYGRVLLQLEREDIPLTKRLRMDLMVNTDREYNIGMNYIITPWMGITAGYHSELEWGLGVRLNY